MALWLLLLTFIGSIVGTAVGFGLSTIMVPVVALFFPLTEALLFVRIGSGAECGIWAVFTHYIRPSIL